jgi:hypothetical protein
LGSFIKAHSGGGGQQLFAVGFVGTAYSTSAIGALVAPLVSGIVADYWISPERLVVLLSLCAAAALGLAAVADSQDLFLAGLLAFFLCYMPTISLVASLTLRRLERPHEQYPAIRAWGTAGWVFAGLLVGWAAPRILGHSIEMTRYPLGMGVVANGLLAILCWRLPPSVQRDSRVRVPRFRLADVGVLVSRQEVWRMLAAGLAASIPPHFYYNYGNVYLNAMGVPYAAAKLTLGQLTEFAFMLMIPVCLSRWSLRSLVMAGVAWWAVRYGLLATAGSAGGWYLIYPAILLHGVAFTLISIPLQLEMHRVSGDRFRATGQGLMLIAMSGVGCLVGARSAGLAECRYLADQNLIGDGVVAAGWRSFWLVPCVASTVLLVVIYVVWGRFGRGAEEPGGREPLGVR